MVAVTAAMAIGESLLPPTRAPRLRPRQEQVKVTVRGVGSRAATRGSAVPPRREGRYHHLGTVSGPYGDTQDRKCRCGEPTFLLGEERVWRRGGRGPRKHEQTTAHSHFPASWLKARALLGGHGCTSKNSKRPSPPVRMHNAEILEGALCSWGVDRVCSRACQNILPQWKRPCPPCPVQRP